MSNFNVFDLQKYLMVLYERKKKKYYKKYECVYNFINTYNCYWSYHNSGYSISII